MKRYLIEPESLSINEPDSTASPSGENAAPGHKIVYRIIDTTTRQILPPESEDIDVVANACAQLNEAYEKAVQEAPEGGEQASSLTSDALPADIVQAIAISNAKSIGEQPAILANLALSQQIFNQNLQQQNAVSHQQALNQIKLAVVGKYIAMIDSVGFGDEAAIEKMGAEIEKLVHQLERILEGKAGKSHAEQAN